MRVNPVPPVVKFRGYPPPAPANVVWCSQCRGFRPREGSVKVVSADGLRYRVVCAECNK